MAETKKRTTKAEAERLKAIVHEYLAEYPNHQGPYEGSFLRYVYHYHTQWFTLQYLHYMGRYLKESKGLDWRLDSPKVSLQAILLWTLTIRTPPEGGTP